VRKITLIGLLLIAAIGTGFASVRLRRPQLVFTPHKIIYRLTSYDEAGKLTRNSVVIREVFADGTWKHTQINPDGPILYSNGKLRGALTSRTPEATGPQHLGLKYFESKSHHSEAWTSPELQDYLMFTTLRDDGSKESRLEAVEVGRLQARMRRSKSTVIRPGSF
jgi:hypothetical protein